MGCFAIIWSRREVKGSEEILYWLQGVCQGRERAEGMVIRVSIAVTG